MSKQRYWLKLLAATLLALTSAIARAAPAQLIGIEITPDTDTTHLTLKLNQAVPYKLFTLSTPDRVIIDLPNTNKTVTLTGLKLANTPIIQVRSGQPVPGTLRIVLDVNKPQQPQVFSQLITKEGSQQLAINLVATVTATAQSKLQPPPQPVAIVPKIAPPRSIVVVIDPGHGGKDPGARGPLGTREKDVVLGISHELYKLLQKEPGFRPTLTRKGDYFIELRQRLAIARQNRGDLFVAVHADAYCDSYAFGASVYALSEHGASSEAVRWLAAKENYSELGDVELKDKSDLLRSVLLDLSQTAVITSSLQLGSSILHQLARVNRLHSARVEQAPFVVLKSPDILSLLIETGFISNPQEERRLRDPAYQRRIAKAIFTGIKAYYWTNPPSGTLVAALRAKKPYGTH